jgi:hypothetical protein
MNSNYRYAAYALAASAIVLLATGAVVVSGVAFEPPTNTGPSIPSDQTNVVTLNETDVQTYDVSLDENGSTFTLDGVESTCSGPLSVDASNETHTDVRVGDTTVTLVEHHDGEAVDDIGPDRLAELVWDTASQRAGLEDHDQVEVQVNQFYETTAREQPLNVAGITVRPVDTCLPTVRGQVDLLNETVTVNSAFADLRTLNLTVTDDIGVLDAAERDRLAALIVSDAQASYNVQRLFDDPVTLDAAVVEATDDGHVDVELTVPGGDDATVGVTVDFEDDTVVRSWTQMTLDASQVVTVDETDTNHTVTVDVEDA